MYQFTMEPNRFLQRQIRAFYRGDFHGYGKPGNPDFLNILKNDPHHHWSDRQIQRASRQLQAVLMQDLGELAAQSLPGNAAVSIVPRAKAEACYVANQLLFKSIVSRVVRQLPGVEDGTGYIRRHTNTRTTHLRLEDPEHPNDGKAPYPGITADTCRISGNAKGKCILLVDDIYTYTVNVDEDAVQALLDAGAHSVLFYAVANTVKRSQ